MPTPSVKWTKETNIISHLHVLAMAPGPLYPLSHGLTTILHGRYPYPLSTHEMRLTPKSPAPTPSLPNLASPCPSPPSHSCQTLLIHSYQSSQVGQLRAIISGFERNQPSSKEEVHQGTFFPLPEYSGLWAVGWGLGQQVTRGLTFCLETPVSSVILHAL